MGGGHDQCPVEARTPVTEVNVDPRGAGTLRVDIKAGDPLSGLYHEQKREQEEACRAQETRGNKRGRQETT